MKHSEHSSEHLGVMDDALALSEITNPRERAEKIVALLDDMTGQTSENGRMNDPDAKEALALLVKGLEEAIDESGDNTYKATLTKYQDRLASIQRAEKNIHTHMEGAKSWARRHVA